MSASFFKQKRPTPVWTDTSEQSRTTSPTPRNETMPDQDYDYHISLSSESTNAATTTAMADDAGVTTTATTTTRATTSTQPQDVATDEALLDLAQLEELQQEAEKMKAIGNKHMAAQEYTKAYNAYSAALQLAPVGPASHVFLSNRAAALLSLKRYEEAATDARRAIALAPAFGKAHARLGQALYFLKDYPAAVTAYQDAVLYEPDNAMTKAYLEKARQKQDKQARKQQLGASSSSSSFNHLLGSSNNNHSSLLSPNSTTTTPMSQSSPSMDLFSMNGSNASVVTSAQYSLATDPGHQHGVGSGYRGSSTAMARAVGPQQHTRNRNNGNKDNNYSSKVGPSDPPTGTGSLEDGSLEDAGTAVADEDPDFDEAIRMQRRANHYLAHKQYKLAVEEYTAALFLVPDDMHLSSDLHLGRAHALNGSRRHEAAKNDAVLALKLNPSAAAYSTLAKSLFYLQDFRGAIQAFHDCQAALPAGESLGMFDRAYLQKAEAALEEEEASLKRAGQRAVIKASQAAVPKLPPPRFVSREQAVSATHLPVPPMPKQWPSPHNHAPLQCGIERVVTFYSEALGMKLNRGPDGTVRVLAVTPATAGSPVVRRVDSRQDGQPVDPAIDDIAVGDVIREAAGVDLRRPITNIMWGDTVALIKMAPRPIVVIVAAELSPVPAAVKAQQQPQQLSDHSTIGSSVVSLASNRSKSLSSELSPSAAAAVSARLSTPSSASDEQPVERDATTTTTTTEATTGTITITTNEQQTPPIAGVDDEDGDIPATAETSSIAAEPIHNPESETLFADPMTVSSAIAMPTSTLDQIDDDDAVRESDELSSRLTALSSVSLSLPVIPASPLAASNEDHHHLAQEIGVDSDAVATTTSADEIQAAFVESEKGVNHQDDDAAMSTMIPNVSEMDTIEALEENDKVVQEPTASLTLSVDDPLVDSSNTQLDQALSDHPESDQNESVPLSLRDQEELMVGGEILFERDARPAYGEWDNLRWLSFSGARQLRFFQKVYRVVEDSKKTLFWRSTEKRYVERALAVYREPSLVLLLRRPKDLAEIHRILGLPDIAELDNSENAVKIYWVVESVADPVTCQLHLSPLTTVTSLPTTPSSSTTLTAREKSCFRLVTPVETWILSAVRMRPPAKKKYDPQANFSDSGAFLETSATELQLAQAIGAAHDPKLQHREGPLAMATSDGAWKHQLVLGTLHSLVLSGNTAGLMEALEHAKRQYALAIEKELGPAKNAEANLSAMLLPSDVIDAVDDCGFTPLYYACSRRMPDSVKILLSAGADVNIAIPGNRGATLAHLCARHWDDRSLSMILSSSTSSTNSHAQQHATRPDPNALDARGWTPMHVAVVEGFGVPSSEHGCEALTKCITALEAWGGQLVVGVAECPKNSPPVQHPLTTLACRWQADRMSLLFTLDLVPYRYPLQPLDVMELEPVTMSLSAMYHYPIHCAIARLQNLDLSTVDSNFLEFESMQMEFLQTIRILVEHGFEPNERLDLVEANIFDFLVGWERFAPLQMLAAIGIQSAATMSPPARDLFAECAELLVSYGARTSLDAPVTKRLRRKNSSMSLTDSHDSAPPSRRSSGLAQPMGVKLDIHKESMEILGGTERLNRVRKAWLDIRVVDATHKTILSRDGGVGDDTNNKDPIPDSDGPGGSDEKSCAICWKPFGMLLNRKHRCRITKRFVCDDCSTKRVRREGTEYRVSDGQFVLAKVDAAAIVPQEESSSSEDEEHMVVVMPATAPTKTTSCDADLDAKKPPATRRSIEDIKASVPKKTLAELRLERLEAEEKSKRSSLFGGMLDQASSLVFGGGGGGEDDDKTRRQQQQQVSGLASSLGQTRDALQERGQKLEQMTEKTSQMVDASADFARMAKELRKKSEGGLFW